MYIYLITANWFTLLVSFSLYAVIIVFLYNIYKTTAELRQFDFRPWRTRLNKRALLLMVIGAVIIVALAFGYAKLTAVWHITESGNERALDLLLRKNPVAMTLDAVIFGPIAEELSFRAFSLVTSCQTNILTGSTKRLPLLSMGFFSVICIAEIAWCH